MNFININLDVRQFDAIKEQLNTSSKVDQSNQTIVFIRVKDLGYDNLWTLRKSVNNFPDSMLVILSTNAKIAQLAWRVGAFYFISLPLVDSQLKTLKYKMIRFLSQREDGLRIKMNYKGGFDMIELSKVCLIKGQGNYCQFFLKDENKSRLYTARIGDISKITDTFPYLIRLNKSLIFNVNLVSRISNSLIHFDGKASVKLKLNQRNKAKVKKQLLWIN